MWRTTPITVFALVALMPWLDPPGIISFDWRFANTSAILISAIFGFLLQWSGALALGYVLLQFFVLFHLFVLQSSVWKNWVLLWWQIAEQHQQSLMLCLANSRHVWFSWQAMCYSNQIPAWNPWLVPQWHWQGWQSTHTWDWRKRRERRKLTLYLQNNHCCFQMKLLPITDSVLEISIAMEMILSMCSS